MTTIMPRKMTCAVCKHEFTSRVLGSTNAMGSPDLDLRPPRMQRDTMHMWVKECPICGYAHTDIEKKMGKAHAGLVLTPEYITCDGIRFKSSLAKRMYKYAMVSANEKNFSNVYSAYLWAAWACDDENDRENAILCRKKALAIYPKLPDSDKEERRLQKADIMRRAGLFDELIKEYSDFNSEQDLLNKINAFQLKCAKARDTSVHTVGECIN